ncbi:MAG: hypothetical protein ACREHE_13410 [Rhizomicrobium sp.]
MSELEVTQVRILSVYWLLIWRGAAGGAVLGIIGGIIAGIVAAATGHSEMGPMWGAILGYLFSIPWFFVVVGMALRKRYRAFRIALVPIEAR